MKPPRILLLALLPAIVGAAPAAVPGSAELQVDPDTATAGETLTASGSLVTDAACLGSRTVRLERRLPEASVWEEVTTGATADDGAFVIEFVADTNATYRVVIAARSDGTTVCDEVASSEAASAIRA